MINKPQPATPPTKQDKPFQTLSKGLQTIKKPLPALDYKLIEDWGNNLPTIKDWGQLLPALDYYKLIEDWGEPLPALEYQTTNELTTTPTKKRKEKPKKRVKK